MWFAEDVCKDPPAKAFGNVNADRGVFGNANAVRNIGRGTFGNAILNCKFEFFLWGNVL